MKFDGKTYLVTTASLKLKGGSGSTKAFEVGEFVKDLYDSESLDIPFGSIRYLEEKDKKHDVDYEYIQFHVNNDTSLNISEIEVGNRFNFLGTPCSSKYGVLVTANFKDGNGRIKGLVDISSQSRPLSQATVIIDGKDDPYRGIYCIELKRLIDDTIKTVVEYFDGEVIDAIESVRGEYTLDDLASFSSEKLNDIGFKHDKMATIDYWPIEETYHTENEMIGHTYAHGSRVKFNQWVDKVFAKENKKENKGPVLSKKN